MMRSKRRLAALVLAWILLAVLAGCRESAQPTPTVLPADSAAQSASVDVRVNPSPSVVGEAALVVTVTDGASPVTGLTINASGDMNHAGMSRVLGTGVEGDPGVYTLPWEWTMGGEWFVAVHVIWPGGAEQVKTITVQVGS